MDTMIVEIVVSTDVAAEIQQKTGKAPDISAQEIIDRYYKVENITE